MAPPKRFKSRPQSKSRPLSKSRSLSKSRPLSFLDVIKIETHQTESGGQFTAVYADQAIQKGTELMQDASNLTELQMISLQAIPNRIYSFKITGAKSHLKAVKEIKKGERIRIDWNPGPVSGIVLNLIQESDFESIDFEDDVIDLSTYREGNLGTSVSKLKEEIQKDGTPLKVVANGAALKIIRDVAISICRKREMEVFITKQPRAHLYPPMRIISNPPLN